MEGQPALALGDARRTERSPRNNQINSEQQDEHEQRTHLE